MAIDFTLTPQQRELQLASRKFARDVLSSAKPLYDKLPTPEERFLATKPAYEAMVAAGFLRKCIPAPAGGEKTTFAKAHERNEWTTDPRATCHCLGYGR